MSAGVPEIVQRLEPGHKYRLVETKGPRDSFSVS